jgi:hypothetical protein
MRWIYLAIIILFAVATIIFALQNFEIITISLFGFCCSRPTRAVGRYRLPAGCRDGRQSARAATPIIRRLKAQAALTYDVASSLGPHSDNDHCTSNFNHCLALTCLARVWSI